MSDEPVVDDEILRKFYEKRIDEGYFDEKAKGLADALDIHVQNGTLSKESQKSLWDALVADINPASAPATC